MRFLIFQYLNLDIGYRLFHCCTFLRWKAWQRYRISSIMLSPIILKIGMFIKRGNHWFLSLRNRTVFRESDLSKRESKDSKTDVSLRIPRQDSYQIPSTRSGPDMIPGVSIAHQQWFSVGCGMYVTTGSIQKPNRWSLPVGVPLMSRQSHYASGIFQRKRSGVCALKIS